MKKIKLTRNKFTVVDDADYEWLNQWKWYGQKGTGTYYAIRKEKGKNIRMHRLILGLTNPKILCDHKDRNGLNNQRNNLRPCTPSQNQMNRPRQGGKSKYSGVSFHRIRQKRVKKNGAIAIYHYDKWRVRLKANGKRLYVGEFDTEVEAAIAYNAAAQKYQGEFANLNQITQ